MRRTLESLVTFCIINDVLSLLYIIAQMLQCHWHSLVYNFKVSTTAQFLIFHQSKVRLDTGSIAVHQQSDGSRWSNNGRLSVTETVFLTPLYRFVPSITSCFQQVIWAMLLIQTNGLNTQSFKCQRCIVSSISVVADNAQHVLLVFLVHTEWTFYCRHFR